MKTFLVTGGAGFIGSNFILAERRLGDTRIINLDLLTYAGNPINLESLESDPDYIFVQGDIRDRDLVKGILEEHRPCAVVNFAAESHVDRSIDGPEDFIQTNVVGTFHLLEEVRRYCESLAGEDKESFRFLHVSTDEVYGSLGPEDHPFCEFSVVGPQILKPWAAQLESRFIKH